MKFQDKLENIITKNNSLVSVGLDSDFQRIPEQFRSEENPIFAFNKAIIQQTADLVSAYKLNVAFYEAGGKRGISQLKQTFEFLNKEHSNIVTILDAKRADIGNTNRGYVEFAFNYLGADAITLHPYLGQEALEPFLERKERGIFVLCRTSNPGSGEFQDLLVGGQPLYKIVARQVVNHWNKNGNCFLVVGATYPQEIAEIRKIAGEMTFLIPGIGAQGGEVKKTVRAGQNSKGKGMIINSSRGIIFARYPKKEARKLKDLINKFRRQ